MNKRNQFSDEMVAIEPLPKIRCTG
jgi:hypothetical protein